jgi:activator of 2-hydroxyglutaryl-CoA dehydratase/predicted nucleotide-binding protein (sugar kinase/HSP70/actin superfamily)
MSAAPRFVGVDVGAETIKIVEVARDGDALAVTRRVLVEHHKEPGRALVHALEAFAWDGVAGAFAVGRLARLVALPQLPQKRAQAMGFAFSRGDRPVTVVSIGSHGFGVLEVRPSGAAILRENSRCSQGTGNFLRQLVERFDMSIDRASALATDVADPSPLSGRCPVILKTDMTHLANRGDDKARILAGLFDAVCENVQVLLKPSVTPPDVLLTGGVTRAPRVRESFRRFCEKNGMRLLPWSEDDALFLEATGCAIAAADKPEKPAPLGSILRQAEETRLEHLPALSGYLDRVKRMPPLPPAPPGDGPVVLGFDIGSTGAKALALDVATRAPVWDAYLYTSGDPVGAAKALLGRFADADVGKRPLVAFGATGSGRDIVGSLLTTCYGAERVHVLNEIAAHAEGAVYTDPRVDTIFEIGGQDAKYIRLSHGRVVDAAMNEACSAGTGSFIEEQGKKFEGIESIAALGREALSAGGGVSLGQHCSVFMAEIIDEAVAAGVDNKAVIAGIYDSIVQNYLNRVKGSRSVGDVVFCQGKPFASDALAAAVARQTGSEVVVPPDPGIMGALGIALLTERAIAGKRPEAVDPEKFLHATVVRRDTFVCKATEGCGGAGNKCRIDRIATLVEGKQQRFTWGGSCSLWDKGTTKKKLPDRSPDPFREREELVAQMIARATTPRGRPRVAMTDELQLKSVFPFFVTFFEELGFDVEFVHGSGHATLKRGIEGANVPFCAPMQHYHGLVSAMAERDAAWIFAPMLRDMMRVAEEEHGVACPLVQASPDVLRWDLGPEDGARILSPVLDFGEGGLDSDAFRETCRKLAQDLGVSEARERVAYVHGRAVQHDFDRRCLDIGRRALAFAAEHGVIPVVVLGRPYTIYNEVLNSHVPPLLREQGAMAIPIDCYPVEDDVPTFHGVFWGHGQKNLRAAHQIRRTPGLYSLWCSNYSCGPDSFNLHFYAYAMAGKPFAVVETDGHSGDAGTKTRIEAFLHCVRQDLAANEAAKAPRSLVDVDRTSEGLAEIRARGETVLVPRMGEGAEVLAAALRGLGVSAEALPVPDAEALGLGRRQTSGKECLPMTLTAGSLFQRLEREKDDTRRFSFFMPTANGPCRFGVYNVLHRILLERNGWGDRVRIWSPVDEDYFEGLPGGFAALVVSGFAALDVLQAALYDARPTEARPGAAQAVYTHYEKELHRLLEDAGSRDLGTPQALFQVATGKLFGIAPLLARAAAELAAVRDPRPMPTVLVVGEIYVRCDAFANDYVIEKLEERGVRARFAPFGEWLEYSDHVASCKTEPTFGARLGSAVQKRIHDVCYATVAKAMGWGSRTTVHDAIDAATPYIRPDLVGEAILTLGGPLHEHRHGLIDGVVSVGPLECMPNKVAEAQFFHAAEREGLLSLTLALNGDAIDPATLDAFAYDVKERFAARQKAGGKGKAKGRRLALIQG